MSVAVKIKNNKGKLPSSWMDLLSEFYPLYPVRSEKDYKRAIAAADKLIGRKLNITQLKYLDSLSILIETYEEERYPIDTASLKPVDILKYLCEENHLSASDLGRILGDRSLGSKILNGQRQLSKAHIVKLSKHFSVEPGLFF